MPETTMTPVKAKLKKVNEIGNTYSGAIAIAGLALTVFLLMRRRT